MPLAVSLATNPNRLSGQRPRYLRRTQMQRLVVSVIELRGGHHTAIDLREFDTTSHELPGS